MNVLPWCAFDAFCLGYNNENFCREYISVRHDRIEEGESI